MNVVVKVMKAEGGRGAGFDSEKRQLYTSRYALTESSKTGIGLGRLPMIPVSL